MAATSSVNTGAAITTAGGLSVVLDYFFNQRFGMQMNPVVLTYIAGALVTLAHFVVNLVNAQLAKDGLPQIQVAATVVTKESGFARLPMLALLIVGAAIALSGCGAINGWVAAKTNIVEQDAVGAVKNQEQVDDDYLKVLKLGACNVKVGALARAPSDMPYVMEGCPIPNTAQVSVNNGAVSLKMPSQVPLAQPVAAAPGFSQEQVQQMINQAVMATAAALAPSRPAPAPAVRMTPRSVPPPASLPAPAPQPKTAPAPVPVAPTPAPKAAPSASMLSPTGGMLPAGK